MMKVLTLTAGILIAMSLTACGSSGSSTATGNPTTSLLGNKTTTTTTTTTDTTTDTTADAADAVDNTANGGTGTTGTTTTTTTKPLEIAGNSIAISTNKIAGNNTAITVGSSDAVNKIMVGGQTIDFLPENFSGTSINQIDIKTGVGRLGEKLDHSTFGYAQETVNGTPYLFSQGDISSNIPVAGIVEYTGTAVHFDNGDQNKLKNPTGLSVEIASFAANFTTKAITGTIGDVDSPMVTLNGTITDNGFSGTTTGGITTNGYFYGDNAAELGGTYKNANGTVSGAYGAKKQ